MQALRVTKDMLKYRENILKLDEFNVLVFDMDTAIDELIFAFRGDKEREFDLSHINRIISYAARNKLGLGEAMKKIVEEYRFPFAEKSLFMKDVIILDMNGGMERIYQLDNYNLGDLMDALKYDQIRGREIEIEDIGEYLC